MWGSWEQGLHGEEAGSVLGTLKCDSHKAYMLSGALPFLRQKEPNGIPFSSDNALSGYASDWPLLYLGARLSRSFPKGKSQWA